MRANDESGDGWLALYRRCAPLSDGVAEAPAQEHLPVDLSVAKPPCVAFGSLVGAQATFVPTCRALDPIETAHRQLCSIDPVDDLETSRREAPAPFGGGRKVDDSILVPDESSCTRVDTRTSHDVGGQEDAIRSQRTTGRRENLRLVGHQHQRVNEQDEVVLAVCAPLQRIGFDDAWGASVARRLHLAAPVGAVDLLCVQLDPGGAAARTADEIATAVAHTATQLEHARHWREPCDTDRSVEYDATTDVGEPPPGMDGVVDGPLPEQIACRIVLLPVEAVDVCCQVVGCHRISKRDDKHFDALRAIRAKKEKLGVSERSTIARREKTAMRAYAEIAETPDLCRVLDVGWTTENLIQLDRELEPYVRCIEQHIALGRRVDSHLAGTGSICVPITTISTPQELFESAAGSVKSEPYEAREFDDYWLTTHFSTVPVVILLLKRWPGPLPTLAKLFHLCSQATGKRVGGNTGSYLQYNLPGFSWSLHTDDDYEGVRSRVHVPLITNERNTFAWAPTLDAWGDWLLDMHLERGKVYETRTDIPHTTFNKDADLARLHLILDVV